MKINSEYAIKISKERIYSGNKKKIADKDIQIMRSKLVKYINI